MSFVHLHTHSFYSPMWGIPTVEALCQTVKQQGQDFLALTDTNGLYGAIRFLDVAREHALKPIIGAEVISGVHRAVLLAKNPTGYANLCRILSARHCDVSFDFIQPSRSFARDWCCCPMILSPSPRGRRSRKRISTSSSRLGQRSKTRLR